ncbi:hypothetical protein F2P81_015802 [Scophthalmus maximus]|uniref:Uncharacterized protein n=1 Tax=Scophthalmus maximus TaxID=52904 RepID=A0A6A4SDF2_SCOMX|nr:hypothetical protein F2P81_015802 [Scophthalmus maximus]
MKKETCAMSLYSHKQVLELVAFPAKVSTTSKTSICRATESGKSHKHADSNHTVSGNRSEAAVKSFAPLQLICLQRLCSLGFVRCRRTCDPLGR